MTRVLLLAVFVALLSSVEATPRAESDKPGFLEGLARTPAQRSGPLPIARQASDKYRHSDIKLSLAPQPSSEVGTALLGGFATWYQDPTEALDAKYAAAGPLIRQALDDWRGKALRVTAGSASTVVQLIDACACGERAGKPTILDLSPAAFADLAPLSLGVVAVEIELVALPLTSTEETP